MKKVLSLLLVLTIVIGMSTVASAKVTVTKDPGTGIGFGGIYKELGDSVAPGHTEKLPLDLAAFEVTYEGKDAPSINLGYVTNGVFVNWTEKEYAAAQKVLASTSASLTAAKKEKIFLASYGVKSIPSALGFTKKDLPKVVARTRIAKGSNVIKTAELNFGGTDKTAQIEVKFVEPFKNNNPDGQAFDIWVFPVVDGKTWDHETYGVNFTGTLKNDTISVDAGTSYVDLYAGYIAKLEANVRNVKFDLGPSDSGEVIIVGKGPKSAKYWGRATQDPTEADLEIMDKNNIFSVYHLEVLGGLDKGANNVELKSASKDDYIFDGNLKFLGMGDSKTIPFAETYYIADHMIEVASEEEPVENTDEELDPLVVPPQTGGNTSAPSGLFDNPSTGA
jgi:hypothetical protein